MLNPQVQDLRELAVVVIRDMNALLAQVHHHHVNKVTMPTSNKWLPVHYVLQVKMLSESLDIVMSSCSDFL